MLPLLNINHINFCGITLILPLTMFLPFLASCQNPRNKNVLVLFPCSGLPKSVSSFMMVSVKCQLVKTKEKKRKKNMEIMANKRLPGKRLKNANYTALVAQTVHLLLNRAKGIQSL